MIIAIEEVWCPNDVQSIPKLPRTCPRCKAAATSYVTFHNGPSDHAHYACGSKYTWKDQIQNHTNKWWFSGPCQRRSTK